MIVFLTGPTGSGKTDTSWALVAACDDIVFLDCDWFASRSRFSWKDRADIDSVYRALASQVQFHMAEGRTRFVITLTLEMAAVFQANSAGFAAFRLPMCAFRLRCRPDVLKGRILERGRLQKDEEASNAIRQQTEFDRLFPDAKIFRSIDTSDLSPANVVTLIVERLCAD